MDRIEFVHISDFHFQLCYSRSPIQQLTDKTGRSLTDMLVSGLCEIRENHPRLDFVAVTGDLTQHGAAADYDQLCAVMLEHLPDVPIFATPGNHDDMAVPLDFSVFPTAAGTPLCVCGFRGLRIISLDSRGGKYESGLVKAEQLAALAKLPASNAGSILLLHHTPHISGETEHLIYQMENPQDLYDTIRGMDIKAIFAGHTHKHFTSMLGEIPCYTAESLTYGIETGFDSMIIHNRTGYNHCVLENGILTVRHIIIEPQEYKEAVIIYSEMDSAFTTGD